MSKSRTPCGRTYNNDFSRRYDQGRLQNPEGAKLYENSDKYRMLLGHTEGFYAGEWSKKDLAPIFGGVYGWPDTCKDARDAARLAVSHYNTLNGKNLEFKKLIRVNAQMAKGIDFFFTIEASDGLFYEARVFHMSENDTKFKFMRPAVHYPRISPDLHHLIGPNAGESTLIGPNAGESTLIGLNESTLIGPNAGESTLIGPNAGESTLIGPNAG